jgi:FdhE protein
MTQIATGLHELQQQHPEWAPWLAVVQVVLSELADAKWDAAVPSYPASQPMQVPLLADAKLSLPVNLLRPMLTHLIRAASKSGSPAMSTLSALVDREVDMLTLFPAALRQDHEALKKIAAASSVDAGAFEAIAALIPAPFLQACHRAWENSLAPGRTENYCPVCGSWPAFAEVRGIERSRYLRCGRCGAGWQAHGLSCPYCGMTDHKELLSLVPENSALNAVIDACKRCLGYLKTFTKLQGSKPANMLLDDLASVELDIAAAEQGYKRPQGAGYFLNVSVAENGARRAR